MQYTKPNCLSEKEIIQLSLALFCLFPFICYECFTVFKWLFMIWNSKVGTDSMQAADCDYLKRAMI